ncbi:pilus assembly FimT family protein [Sphingomonas sp. 8AM]|uniref:pilus assembly FimT family protein n=1 Tax=Sphingomonas sp. 8AM TaxID=2653170 RepID=UPI0012F14282|nr:prepilin-type N-terminal cleavage/methylation domain-containing protein [Sphingomonas sp. 8AM]VXD01401.1 General secretion pathway protein H [Sphingomonas sp. 8AM]
MSAIGEPRVAAAQSGYTLLEALVVLAILGLVAGIGFPQIDRALRLQSAREGAARLERALHGARATAPRRSEAVRFVVTPDGHGFGYGERLERLPDDLVAASPEGDIVFFPDGSAHGGTLELRGSDLVRGWRIRAVGGLIERMP